MASSPLARGHGAAQEPMRARPTKRRLQSRLLPKLKHLAMISTLIQKRSDLRLRLGLTNIFMPHCSHRTTYKVDLPRQSSCLVAGIIKPTTRAHCERVAEIACRGVQLHHGAREGQAGSHWDLVPAIQAARLLFQGE